MSQSARPRVINFTSSHTADDILGNGSEYFEYLGAQYIHNLLKNTDPDSAVAYRICSTFEINNILIEDLKDWPVKKAGADKKEIIYPHLVRPKKNSVRRQDWDILVGFFKGKLTAHETPPKQDSAFDNIDMLSQALSLKTLETETLKFIHYYSHDFYFESFCKNLIKDDPGRAAAAIARMIDRPEEMGHIRAMFDPYSPFVKYGLLEIVGRDEDGDVVPFPQIESNIENFIKMTGGDGANLVETILGKPYQGELNVNDFSYMAEDIDQIVSLIERANKNRTAGVNILLYGPAGSGKTELAKAIAAKAGFSLYGIGEHLDGKNDFSGPDAASKNRLASLFQAHAFLQEREGVVLLFDEVEDLLMKGTDAEKKAEPPSKIIVNRLLENNPIPTIWAGNDPEKFHESMRQRFTYSLYVDYPPTEMRKKIWNKQLEISRAKMDERDVTLLARRYLAPARMIAGAVKHSGEGQIQVSVVEKFLRASSRLTYGDAEAIESGAGLSEKFNIELINYSEANKNEMGAIIADGKNTRPYAILVQGLPGSGLRSFGRFMAEKGIINHAEYDMRALLAPNPLSPPEQNIKSAFDSARNQRKLLVFAHLDAFAENPLNDAARNWSASLSHIFLECLMNHPIPVIAHSYNPDAVFPGFIKDCFSMHMKVSPLNQEQCQMAMTTYFPQVKEENTRGFPANLVAGDFAQVEKIFRRSTNGHTSWTKIVEKLEQQVEFRDEGRKNKFGF